MTCTSDVTAYRQSHLDLMTLTAFSLFLFGSQIMEQVMRTPNDLRLMQTAAAWLDGNVA